MSYAKRLIILGLFYSFTILSGLFFMTPPVGASNTHTNPILPSNLPPVTTFLNANLLVAASPLTATVSITPTELAVTLPLSSTVTDTLTIMNTGTSPLVWSMAEHNGIASLSHAPNAVLYNNGSAVSNPGGGAGGADLSMLQIVSLGMSTAGFGHQTFANDWVADDFVVPAGEDWTIDTVTFFAYQTGSTTTSTITGYNYRVYDGAPNISSTMIFSGSTILTTTWANSYRASETTTANTNRPIMATIVDFGGLSLPAGTYWVEWQAAGSLASGPWAPPITILGQPTTGNALQNVNGTYIQAVDVGTNTPQQGFPFIMEGTSTVSCDIDIPWLTLNPTAGTINPNSSAEVVATFDPTGYSPGIYTGTLCLNSNDPLTSLVTVPVSMTVLENVYGFELETNTTAITDTAGATVTYTVWVTNTGNVNDTYTVELSGYSWDTQASSASLSLNPGEAESVTIQVTIPATVTGSLVDVATLTITSAGDVSVSEQINLTTTAETVYGLEMLADTTAITDTAGATITYTVWVTNTGNVNDTYTVELSGYSWDTQASSASLNLDPGEEGSVTIQVTIPATATNGLVDVATLTLTSTGEEAVSEQLNLTTTADVVYGLEMLADTTAITDTAGATITYTVWVTNTGNVNDTYTVELSGHSWDTEASHTSLSLAPGEMSEIMVMVTVPMTATGGMTDTAMLMITSQGDDTVSEMMNFTTIAVSQTPAMRYIYLPVINREP